LDKVWNLYEKLQTTNHKPQTNPEIKDSKLDRLAHQTIKKVGEDIDNARFNTAIPALMILANEFEKQEELPVARYSLLITLLSPFAPHMAEELWQKLGHDKSIFLEKWPEYDKKMIQDQKITFIIQVNGKLRDSIETDASISEEEAKKLAISSKKIENWIDFWETVRTPWDKNK